MTKVQKFKEWCTNQKIIMPNLEYPAYFDDGLMGFKTKKRIDHRELVLGIPYSICMTNDKAIKDPILGKVFTENPALFSE
jgi:hypothetical protein